MPAIRKVRALRIRQLRVRPGTKCLPVSHCRVAAGVFALSCSLKHPVWPDLFHPGLPAGPMATMLPTNHQAQCGPRAIRQRHVFGFSGCRVCGHRGRSIMLAFPALIASSPSLYCSITECPANVGGWLYSDTAYETQAGRKLRPLPVFGPSRTTHYPPGGHVLYLRESCKIARSMCPAVAVFYHLLFSKITSPNFSHYDSRGLDKITSAEHFWNSSQQRLD